MPSVSGEAVFERIDQLRQLIGELEPILQSLMLNDSTIVDGLAQMLATMQHIQHRNEEHISALAADIRELGKTVQHLSPPASPDGIRAADVDREDPELALLAHLLPYLPNPQLIDVGANNGDFAGRLVDAGYEVFAFEPFIDSFERLQRTAAVADGRLHAFHSAIGATNGTIELLVATDTSGLAKWNTSLFHSTVAHPMLSDLSFAPGIQVPIRTIASLLQDGTIPPGPATLKIDTEGADLDVIKGADPHVFEVVLMEFWDRTHPFGRAGHGDLPILVQEMRSRAYPWHIVIYRVDERNEIGFYSNLRTSIATSWGNIVFFRNFSTFTQAAAWCTRAFAAAP
jgi:FkbM family methyltransferase